MMSFAEPQKDILEKYVQVGFFADTVDNKASNFDMKEHIFNHLWQKWVGVGHSRDEVGQSETDAEPRKTPGERKKKLVSPDVLLVVWETVWSCAPQKLALALAPL